MSNCLAARDVGHFKVKSLLCYYLVRNRSEVYLGFSNHRIEFRLLRELVFHEVAMLVAFVWLTHHP